MSQSCCRRQQCGMTCGSEVHRCTSAGSVTQAIPEAHRHLSNSSPPSVHAHQCFALVVLLWSLPAYPVCCAAVPHIVCGVLLSAVLMCAVYCCHSSAVGAVRCSAVALSPVSLNGLGQCLQLTCCTSLQRDVVTPRAVYQLLNHTCSTATEQRGQHPC
jgi:hypothetical protein